MLTHKGTKTIKTERLILRKFEVADAKAMYHNWAKDERVTKFLTWPPHESEKATEELLKLWCADYKKDNYYQWVITLDSIPVGSISVVDFSENHEHAELGYCLGYDYWRKGIMPEAVNAVINFLFSEAGFNRITICHAVKNPASGAVARKCGLAYEGTKKEEFKSHSGEFLDIAFYGITKKEWESKKQ